jgi:hypothetical protein
MKVASTIIANRRGVRAKLGQVGPPGQRLRSDVRGESGGGVRPRIRAARAMGVSLLDW